MQEVSRKALPGDFLNSFFPSNLARSCYLLCVAGVLDRAICPFVLFFSVCGDMAV